MEEIERQTSSIMRKKAGRPKIVVDTYQFGATKENIEQIRFLTEGTGYDFPTLIRILLHNAYTEKKRRY